MEGNEHLVPGRIQAEARWSLGGKLRKSVYLAVLMPESTGQRAWAGSAVGNGDNRTCQTKRAGTTSLQDQLLSTLAHLWAHSLPPLSSLLTSVPLLLWPHLTSLPCCQQSPGRAKKQLPKGLTLNALGCHLAERNRCQQGPWRSIQEQPPWEVMALSPNLGVDTGVHGISIGCSIAPH